MEGDVGEMGGEGRSCRRHLGRNSPLTLQLRLVLLERLLTTALKILTLMVLRHTMLDRDKGESFSRQRHSRKGTYVATELETAMRATTDNAQHGLVAAGLRLELAALLGGHCGRRVV